MREMTAQEALHEISTMVFRNTDNLEMRISKDCYKNIVSSLEKQIPKKPYKVKEHKQNDYYCIVCKRYLGDDMELKYACLQPEYCQHCGQVLDWSDHPTEKGGGE